MMPISVNIDPIKTIRFQIEICPISWKVGTIGGNGRSIVKPESLKVYQEAFILQALRWRPEKKYMELPVCLMMNFLMPLPKSMEGYTGSHIKKSDGTNLFKATEDAMTGVFYKDDCQVCVGLFSKSYVRTSQDKPFVEVKISYLKE